MGATFNRLKNWIAEVLTYADLNAEIDNILSNLGPAGVDDYSSNTTQMRTDTDPGESGSESQATSLAGELERLRFAIREIKGSGVTYWYQSASTSLSELASALGTSTLANRISSGRSRTGSSQPLFLVPNGAARTVALKGATTPFVFFYESTQVTISSDVTATGLTAAPSSNNTCLINMPGVNDEAWTKQVGEFGTTIPVDNMGSELTALTGKLVGLKLAGSATEYMIARIDSATQLSQARRGYFFDSTDAPIPRATFADNDTITLMKLTYIYAKSDGTLQPGYTNPTVSADEPTSPAIGDYWLDLSANKWKYYSGAWADLDGILVGVCLQDSSNTVAARGFDFFKNHSDLNTARIERASATTVVSSNLDADVAVYGSIIRHTQDRLLWNAATDFDSGVAEAASTVYFLYMKESGDRIISDLAPMDRTADLRGLYHPFHTWRCLGQVYNNGSSDFVAAIDYANRSPDNFKVTTQVGSSACTFILHANPLSEIQLNAYNTTDIVKPVRIPFFISVVVSSGSTLGHLSATATAIHLYIMNSLGTPFLGVSTDIRGTGIALSSTAEGGAGGADSATTLYTTSALTSVPTKLIATLSSTLATAGTWDTAPTALALFPYRFTGAKVTDITSGSGTFVPTPGCTLMEVEVQGPGGGGAGSGTGGDGGTGSTGSPTYFRVGASPDLLVGSAGSGGACNANGGAGASGSTNALSGVTQTGGQGQASTLSGATTEGMRGGAGGTNRYGGAGMGGLYNSVGQAAVANTGAGGGGAGQTGAVGNAVAGSGGGAGGYAKGLILNPNAAGYAYSVGASVSGGTAGTSGFAGGASGSGRIVVWEYFD